jgi:RNA polymerase sigma factor (sigma-70 family)
MCHPATLADGELLAAFRASRSPEAFAALVARHGPWVQRLCRRRLGCHQDAEDATQTVFLALARQPERVHYCLAGWLCRAAQRAVKDLQRAAARRARREEVAALTRRPGLWDGTTELREEVAVVLGRLPTRLRQPLVLRYLEGLGQREAAQRLGCPQGTLATRTREGLLRLRSLASPLKSCGGICKNEEKPSENSR